MSSSRCILSGPRRTTAQAIVVECMALQPHLQWLSESRFLRSTHGVITNARADHLDVMGPTERDAPVADALRARRRWRQRFSRPRERGMWHFFEKAARDRGCVLVAVGAGEVPAKYPTKRWGGSPTWNTKKMSPSRSACVRTWVSTGNVALRGMAKAPPDPGVMTISHIRFFGRDIYFVNAFAAGNFPSLRSSFGTWPSNKYRGSKSKGLRSSTAGLIARCARSSLDRACVHWHAADHYLLIGSATYLFLKSAISEGMPLKSMIVTGA